MNAELEHSVTPLARFDPELVEQMGRWYASTKTCCTTLFPERFTRPFRSLHDEAFEALDNDKIQKLLLLATRGFGKTSICSFGFPAKRILFQESKFIVPVSCSSTSAVMQAENLKRELVQNKQLQQVGFPPIESKFNFARDMWDTSTGIRVMPRGRGQQIRGLLYGNHRPDLIIVDDIEDTETVRSEEQRQKLKDWFFSDLMLAVDKSKNNWRIVVVGTVLHEDSLLASLAEDPSWHTVHVEICGDDCTSRWPEFMTTQALLEEMERYRAQGLLDVFYREFRNILVSPDTACFRSSYFQYYEEGTKEFASAIKPHLENVVLIDPAKTVSPHSADSAIVGVGVDTINQGIYVRDLVSGKFHPDEMYDHIFKMCERLRATVIGLEVTSLNEFITWPFMNEMRRRGLHYEVVELKARGQKEDRIRALIPLYRMGQVYHNKACCLKLESQLVSFPKSKLWDCMDALAYIAEMCAQGGRYFFPENSKKQSVDAIEAEFAEVADNDYEIEDERGLSPSWGIA